MVLRLKSNDFLRLERAAGTRIEVLAGRVWITEPGRACDNFLVPGQLFRISGNGLVLVGTETYSSGGSGADITLRPA